MNKIEYLRVILTERCNLSCFFCHREGEYEIVKQENKQEDLLQMIRLCIENGTKKLKFLGGEPTLVQWLPDIIRAIRSEFKNIDISVVSNGITQESVIMRLINSGIDRVNISLHGFDNRLFHEITHGTDGQLDLLFSSISLLQEHGKLGKLNYVILKGVNEQEFFDVINFANEHKLVLDVLNYIGTDVDEVARLRYSFEEIIDIISSKYVIKEKCKYINPYSLSSTRLFLEAGGIVNLKTTELNSTDCFYSCSICKIKEFCTEGIKAIRLTPNGKLRPCVFRDDNCFDFLWSLKNKGKVETNNMLRKYLEQL